MTSARGHVAALAQELALLMGAAEQSGVAIRTRTRETLHAAFSYLSDEDQPTEPAVNPAPGPDEAYPDEQINKIEEPS